MGLFSIEHSQAAYRIDFVAYAGTAVVLAVALLLHAAVAPGLSLQLLLVIGIGLAGWTLAEYALHRFVLHGLQPFAAWHEAHHQRPTALICSPTLFSGSLFAGLLFLPAWLLSDVWLAAALTLGVTLGYLVYAVIHHALHHWRSTNAWLRQRKRWHALHHQSGRRPQHFGVSTAFWDHVFGTSRAAAPLSPPPHRAAVAQHPTQDRILP